MDELPPDEEELVNNFIDDFDSQARQFLEAIEYFEFENDERFFEYLVEIIHGHLRFLNSFRREFLRGNNGHSFLRWFGERMQQVGLHLYYILRTFSKFFFLQGIEAEPNDVVDEDGKYNKKFSNKQLRHLWGGIFKRK